MESQETGHLTAGQNLLDTTLNLGIILFLVWLVGVLVIRGQTPQQDDEKKLGLGIV